MSNHIYYPPYYVKNYWWKFSNFLSYFFDGNIENEADFTYTPSRTDFMNALGDWAYDGLEAQYPNLCETINDNMVIKQPVYDVFLQLEKRFADHYIFSTEHDDGQEARNQAYKFFKKLFNVIEYTYQKYAKIIELYQTNYNTLMRELQTETESGSRYNDTPQSKEVDLSFEENQYTTNLTKSKSLTKTDSNTPIVKIEEIMRNYRNIVLEWLNEFDSLFVEEHNV